jgi:hypothetical protein
MKPTDYQKEIRCCLDDASGHLIFFEPAHPLARQNGMVSMGRHVLSKKLHRWLGAEECVHYVDGNPQNVYPDNLVLVTRAQLASRIHNNKVEGICAFCGKPFPVSPSHLEKRSHCSDPCRRLHSRRFEIQAEVLKTMVWEMPTTEIARIYGVSDKAIEKRCKLFGIAKPPRGYWSRLAAGKAGIPVWQSEESHEQV